MKVLQIIESRERCAEAGWFAYDFLLDAPLDKEFIRNLRGIGGSFVFLEMLKNPWLFFPINYVTLIRVLQFFHLNDTRIGIIITFTGAMIPFCVFTIYNFISSVPTEMDEAAVIDGAGPLNLFFRIIVPMLKPTMVTCFILQFMTVWSDFLTPLYLSSKSKMFPMTMSVYQFFGKNKNSWNYIFADIILTCLPVIIVYLLGQRYIIGGLTSGAVKE